MRLSAFVMRLFAFAAIVALAAFSTFVPSPDPVRAGFVGTVGDTTVVFAETLVRTDDTLDGVIALFGGPGVHGGYTAELAPDARVRALTIWQRPLDAAEVQQASRIEIGPDSVRVIAEQPTASEKTFAIEQPVMPYVNPSIGLLEQIVRRALALGDSATVAVPLFYVSGQERVLDAEVRFVTPDSLHLVVNLGNATSATAVCIDDAGHVVSGGSVQGAFRFRRVPYDEAAALLPPAPTTED